MSFLIFSHDFLRELELESNRVSLLLRVSFWSFLVFSFLRIQREEVRFLLLLETISSSHILWVQEPFWKSFDLPLCDFIFFLLSPENGFFSPYLQSVPSLWVCLSSSLFSILLLSEKVLSNLIRRRRDKLKWIGIGWIKANNENEKYLHKYIFLPSWYDFKSSWVLVF